jgi:hypothetical protein
MNVLVACEYSGRVRDAFNRLGHHAVSADLLDTESEYNPKNTWIHHRGDVFDIINEGWDLMLAFPPCTHLCVSGARWFKDKIEEQEDGVLFFLKLAACKIPRIIIENPIGIMSTKFRKPDQIIQPWQFGHGETKATCLWLKNLPKLVSTEVVPGREARIHKMSPGPDRSKERSRTYQGIADAMAKQWGGRLE